VTEQYSSFVRVCIASRSIGIIICDFFPFEFSSIKSFRDWIAIEYLRTQVCTAPTLSKSEKILMSLNSKQLKATLPTGNYRTLPQRDRETAKNDKQMN